jgi:hypothetical protein
VPSMAVPPPRMPAFVKKLILPARIVLKGRVGTVDPVGMACPPLRTVHTPFGVYGSPS